MDYHSARDMEHHSTRKLFEYREDSNEATFVVAAMDKIYAHDLLTLNDTVACKVISKWKAALKEAMDARSDVDQSGNTLRVSQSRFYNEKLVQTLLEGHSILSLEGSLSGDCDVEKNGKWSCIYAVGSHEYQVVCTRRDIASADVGMLDGFDRGLQTYVQEAEKLLYMMALLTTKATYMTLTEAAKETVWLKGLAVDNVSKTNERIDKLADQISNLVEIVNKQVMTLASAKAVDKTCVIYEGAHAYYDCIATDSNQVSVCAATGTYNQVSPPNRANHQIPPPSLAPIQNNPNRFNQNQGKGKNFNRGNNFQNNQGIPNELSSYMKSNVTLIRIMQNQINVLRGDFNKQEENLRRNLNNDMRSILGTFFQNQASTSGTLPSNTMPNAKGKMKTVTTRSGLPYERPAIPTNSPLEKTKAVDYGHIKWIEDLVPCAMWIQQPIDYNRHALWGVSHWGRKRQQFYGYAVNRESAHDVYSKRRIIAVTELKIVEWHDYKHLDWISVSRDDDKIYKFKEGDLKRPRLQDIKDMLLLLVQGKLSNRTVEERFAFNVSLRMFTRSIVIKRRVEDLQLGVESYQKRLNLTKPDTYRLDLKRREAYTAHSKPRGFIYQNKDKKNRLMRIDELHKFSDGTLNDVRNTLDDRLKGIRMQYDKKEKSEKLRRVLTEMELILEHTQQGISYEVSVSTEGVEELKRNDKIKGVKKEALLIHLGRNRDNTYAIRNTQLLSGIEDSRHVTQ
nr:zinc finger, CCHC-type [Tanacetum cinerariifolium]